MKTAISIPDHVFLEAERLAKRLKKSRSQLYSEAVAEYTARHDEDAITESWNKVLSDPEAQDPELDAFVAEASRRILERAE
jgi:metal-responsive CopG/Arc/MetJ family transcriptional regulator